MKFKSKKHQANNWRYLLGTCVIVAAMQQIANAQHFDITFEYVDNKIILLSEPDGIATSNFPTSGGFEGYTDDPGFLSENNSGLGIGGNDIVVYNILDDLIYWNGTSFDSPAPGTQIVIDNNAGSDTIVTTSSGIQLGDTNAIDPKNFIQQASVSGDVHSHVDFTLEIDGSSANPLFGSYGLKISVETDAVGIEASDPIFIHFNYGLDSAQYDAGYLAFQSLLAPPVLSGDFNDDGMVDAADYTVWRDNLNAPDESSINDAGDGLNGVDAADYALWVTNYGNSSSSTSALSVPEPSSLLLLITVLTSTLAQPKQ